MPVELLSVLLKLPEIQGAKIIPYIIEEGIFININDALNSTGIIENYWNDVLQMARELSVEDAELALLRCTSEDDLFNLHVRWIQRLNSDEDRVQGNVEFPEPPFPDSKNIVAIKTSDELMEEGRNMNHCVGAYATDVLAGQCYIYRVLRPERATLELRAENGIWQMGQFKLKNNAKPGRASQKYVMEWLRQDQIVP